MMAHFRRYLIAGLLVWVPLGITVLVIKFLVDLLDGTVLLLPENLRPEHVFGFKLPGVGVLLTLIVLLVTGIVAANLVGRKLVAVGEHLLARIPLVRSIYYAVKQVTETLLSGNGKSFRSVVLVEYPRKGMWTLAFLTGQPGAKELEQKTGHSLSHVFVPTTPNPTSGFFLVLPSEDVVTLDMSIDEGLRMIMSGGVVMPDARKDVLLRRKTKSA